MRYTVQKNNKQQCCRVTNTVHLVYTTFCTYLKLIVYGLLIRMFSLQKSVVHYDLNTRANNVTDTLSPLVLYASSKFCVWMELISGNLHRPLALSLVTTHFHPNKYSIRTNVVFINRYQRLDEDLFQTSLYLKTHPIYRFVASNSSPPRWSVFSRRAKMSFI